MAKYFYTEHGNHISNLTTTVQKRRERSVAKISTIPPPLRGTTTKWLILDCYEIANQIDETGASIIRVERKTGIVAKLKV